MDSRGAIESLGNRSVPKSGSKLHALQTLARGMAGAAESREAFGVREACFRCAVAPHLVHSWCKMKKPHKMLLGLALIVVLAGLAIYFFLPQEPRYNGKKLSTWLREFEAEQMDRRAAAAEAVRHIGPDAVPFLVQRLQSPDPTLKKASRLQQWKQKVFEYLGKYSLIPRSLGQVPNPRRQAFAGLDALGPAGRAALPALERLLYETPPDPAALYLVARIGEAGEPVLRTSLTNEEKVIRLQAVICLDMMKQRSETLYPRAEPNGETAGLVLRLCQFNLKVLQAAFQEYKISHPDQILPDDFLNVPVSTGAASDVLDHVETNGVQRTTVKGASAFE
jgi:hypothetical protein